MSEEIQNTAARAIADVAERDRRIAALEHALKPFAAYSDPRGQVPTGYVITQGSALAKKQLTMGDCYFAAHVLGLKP